MSLIEIVFGSLVVFTNPIFAPHTTLIFFDVEAHVFVSLPLARSEYFVSYSYGRIPDCEHATDISSFLVFCESNVVSLMDVNLSFLTFVMP